MHLIQREREFFVDNLLVRVHVIIEMFVVDRPCAMKYLHPILLPFLFFIKKLLVIKLLVGFWSALLFLHLLGFRVQGVGFRI